MAPVNQHNFGTTELSLIKVDLWNVAFKEVISGLQNEAANLKLSILDKTKKSEIQTTLSWFLDFASGFYVLLLQEICVVYDLDLPFLRSAGFYGVASDLETNSDASEVKKCQNVSSINYICTHCLIHLGQSKHGCGFSLFVATI